MELEIQGRIAGRLPVQNSKPHIEPAQQQAQQNEKQKEIAEMAEKQIHEVQKPVSRDEIERYLKKALNDASILNRDLRYSINRETNRIIVKVVDKTTDKVIKEIPPEAIQRLQDSIREAIGLLVDEQI